MSIYIDHPNSKAKPKPQGTVTVLKKYGPKPPLAQQQTLASSANNQKKIVQQQRATYKPFGQELVDDLTSLPNRLFGQPAAPPPAVTPQRGGLSRPEALPAEPPGYGPQPGGQPGAMINPQLNGMPLAAPAAMGILRQLFGSRQPEMVPNLPSSQPTPSYQQDPNPPSFAPMNMPGLPKGGRPSPLLQGPRPAPPVVPPGVPPIDPYTQAARFLQWLPEAATQGIGGAPPISSMPAGQTVPSALEAQTARLQGMADVMRNPPTEQTYLPTIMKPDGVVPQNISPSPLGPPAPMGQIGPRQNVGAFNQGDVGVANEIDWQQVGFSNPVDGLNWANQFRQQNGRWPWQGDAAPEDNLGRALQEHYGAPASAGGPSVGTPEMGTGAAMPQFAPAPPQAGGGGFGPFPSFEAWQQAFAAEHGGRMPNEVDVQDAMDSFDFAAQAGRNPTMRDWKRRYYTGGFWGEGDFRPTPGYGSLPPVGTQPPWAGGMTPLALPGMSGPVVQPGLSVAPIGPGLSGGNPLDWLKLYQARGI